MDNDFQPDRQGLARALELLTATPSQEPRWAFPDTLPEQGIGSAETMEMLAPQVLGRASRLGGATSMAHMDPPTPWITWATTLWNSALNQNLLHPATAPVARDIEAQVVRWLAPFFGMSGGHMVPGSSVANLTALWAARECAGVKEVICSQTAHLSVSKAAHLLGLQLRLVPAGPTGAIDADHLPADMSQCALVLTAGSTSTGSIDDLALAGKAAWTHVDAAWAGPLRLSPKHADRLAGIGGADSVAVSAHKWLFQPKESALVLFRDVERAHPAISFGGAYLAVPNIGVLGSHGAAAVPLLATLCAWGREGLAKQIERCMAAADQLAGFVAADTSLELLMAPATGVVVWRPRDHSLISDIHANLPENAASLTTLPSGRWLRNVAANPNIEVDVLVKRIQQAIDQSQQAEPPSSV